MDRTSASPSCRGGSPRRSALVDRRFILRAIRFIFRAPITNPNALKISSLICRKSAGTRLAVSKVGPAFRCPASRVEGAQMSHHDGPTVQPRADAFYRLHDDVMPIPEAFVPTGRCRLACPECLCIEKGSLSAASGAGLPTHKGTGVTENPPQDQVRKGRPKRVLSTLFSRVSGGRLEVMNAHTREQPADRSNAAICPHSGPLLPRRHLARRHAPPSVAFSPSRRRPGGRVPFDGAGVVQTIVAASGGRPLSCAKEATAGKRCGRGGSDERHRRIDRRCVR